MLVPDSEVEQGSFDSIVVTPRRGALLPSATCEWATPGWLFRELNDEFGFTVDVAATPQNTQCKRFFAREQNGLIQPWRGERVWCNPPYDVAALTAFTSKAFAETQAAPDTLAVLLVPCKTDQKWFHSVAIRCEVRFIRGRVVFGGAKNSAPMPVCVLVVSQHHRPGCAEWNNDSFR